jgi:hypothetical protein
MAPFFVRGSLTIEWGNLINNHLPQQQCYSFTAEYWGMKIMSINWKYVLKLWSMRNAEVTGETTEQTKVIRQQQMIDEVIHIQNTNLHLQHMATVNQLGFAITLGHEHVIHI